MATQVFHVLNKEDYGGHADVVVVSRDKKVLGGGEKLVAPSGRNFLKVRLKDYWIISDEEYKKLKNL
jgi:hypothetical protein